MNRALFGQIRLVAATLALCLPDLASGQTTPGANVVVRPRVTSIAFAGGAVTLALTVEVDPASPESLFIFTIDAPATPNHIVSPQPAADWDVSPVYRGRSVASWGALATVAPGDSTPTLVYTASGLPGIDTAWAEGYFGVPLENPADTADVAIPDPDPLVARSVRLLTVGIDPIPPGSTAASLTTRLDSLRGQTCSLNWITSGTLCTTLQGYLTTQPANLTQFNADLATGHTTGGPVSDNAYWLLKANADYILSISPPPVNTALITLGYVCGNKFKVRNRNPVAVPLTWDLINHPQTGSLTVPAMAPGGEPGSAFITTIEKRTLRLYYNGQRIATVANGNKTCPP